MKHKKCEQAKIGKYAVNEKGQERFWRKCQKAEFASAKESQDSVRSPKRETLRIWGLGSNPNKQKKHEVDTHALLASFIRRQVRKDLRNKLKRKEGMYMNVFEAVKENIRPLDAAKLYGLKVTRNGMCRCPFHNDRHPSLKIDDRPGGGFYCFGCHTSGDVISLVAKLYGISNHDAAVKLADDFGIVIDGSPEKRSMPSKIKPSEWCDKAEADQAFAIRKRDLCQRVIKLLRDMYAEKCDAEGNAMKLLEENEVYVWLINRQDSIENDFDFLMNHTNEEIRTEIDKIESEVAKYVGEFDRIRRNNKRTS